MDNIIPVITIDGPSGTGKGTISKILAQKLGWHFLDSGIIYRVLALMAMRQQISSHDQDKLEELASQLELKDYTEDEIRSPECSALASKISAYPKIRQILLERQRVFRKPPGLVTDGRDMGTVVFPDAQIKIFLVASTEIRAKRRYAQLQEKGINVSLEGVLADLAERDKRDTERAVAPLKPAHDAWVLDTSDLTVNEVFERVYQRVSSLL